jgi:hypothetical protein
MREVYSEKTAQKLADERWLKKCSREDWVVFSKDKKLRRRTSKEYRAVHRYKNRCFVLPKGKFGEAEQIRRYVDNRFRIALRARKAGPYIIAVHADGLGKDYIADADGE